MYLVNSFMDISKVVMMKCMRREGRKPNPYTVTEDWVVLLPKDWALVEQYVYHCQGMN